MDSTIDKGVQSLGKVRKALNTIDDALAPLEDSSYNETIEELSSLETIKLNVSLAFTLASLCYIGLNVNGIDTKTHPIKAELDRIKSYVERIRNIEESRKRKIELDVPAATRTIQFEMLKNKKRSGNGG